MTEQKISTGWELNQIKWAKMLYRGEGFLSFPSEMGLSLHVKQQQPNKSGTYGMTNSRLWHPSDPKHVLIISPWLPVGVDVISTHIPTGETSYKLLLRIRVILASGVWNEAIKAMKEFNLNRLALIPTQIPQLCYLRINI